MVKQAVRKEEVK